MLKFNFYIVLMVTNLFAQSLKIFPYTCGYSLPYFISEILRCSTYTNGNKTFWINLFGGGQRSKFLHLIFIQMLTPLGEKYLTKYGSVLENTIFKTLKIILKYN